MVTLQIKIIVPKLCRTHCKSYEFENNNEILTCFIIYLNKNCSFGTYIKIYVWIILVLEYKTVL